MRAFMITRDRLSYARRCAAALTAAGLDLVIVDHGSMYGPMPRWLRWMEQYAKATVVREPNRHPRDLWRPGGPIETHVGAGERFVVTDHDVVPADSCPADWVDQLGWLLDRLPTLRKAGLGLRTDDLPVHFEHAEKVRQWERQWQAVEDGGDLHWTVGEGRAVVADIDTTLAMYRHFEPFALGPAVRTRAPFEALHLPWYEDSANLTPEQVYYRDHAEHGHWRAPDGFADEHALGG